MPNRSFIATGPFSQICQKESLPQALLASVTMILAKFQSWSPPVYPKNAFGMLKFKRPFYQFVYGLQGARRQTACSWHVIAMSNRAMLVMYQIWREWQMQLRTLNKKGMAYPPNLKTGISTAEACSR